MVPRAGSYPGPMAGVSAVVLDWYGTLAVPHGDDFWARLDEIVVEAGGRPDPDALAEWELEHPAEHRRHSVDEPGYRAWQRRRLDHVLARCGLAVPQRTRVLDHIETVRYTRLFSTFPDVPAALARLRERGLVVGLCSNWDWDLDRHLDHNGITGLLDFVVCSASVGYRKPHPAIFEEVVGHAGVPAGEILFVGDSWGDDVAGAAAAGLVPVHIARSGPCARDDHCGVPCVPDLAALARLPALVGSAG